MRTEAPWTLPSPGDTRVVRARSRYLARTARLLLDWPHPLPHTLVRPYADLRDSLASVDRTALLTALSLPQVGAPLHAGLLEEAVPALLLELARTHALDRTGIWWGAPIHRLLSAPLGWRATFDPPIVGALFSTGEVAVSDADPWDLGEPRGERRFHALRHGGWLALADHNPLAMVEAHPDKRGNAVDLGGKEVADWVAAIDEARALVAEALPELHREHATILAQVVPVGFHPEISESASYREAIGVVYVSLHPRRRTLAEALVHETQHNKLNLLSHLDPILENADGSFPSPVRPDPRPLWGVLLAVHAFVPVERLHDHLAEVGHPEASTSEFAAWRATVRANNRAAVATLAENGRWTAVGQEIWEGLRGAVAGAREGV